MYTCMHPALLGSAILNSKWNTPCAYTRAACVLAAPALVRSEAATTRSSTSLASGTHFTVPPISIETFAG